VYILWVAGRLTLLPAGWAFVDGGVAQLAELLAGVKDGAGVAAVLPVGRHVRHHLAAFGAGGLAYTQARSMHAQGCDQHINIHTRAANTQEYARICRADTRNKMAR